MKELRYLNKYLYKYRHKLILGLFITIIARVFSLVMPSYVSKAIEVMEQWADGQLTRDVAQGLLFDHILVIIGASALAALFTFLMRQTIINVSRYIEYDLKDEVLDVHRDSALELIASGKMSEAAARSLNTASGTKPLGRLIAGFVAVEHGQLEAARQHVEEARKDETLVTPASLLESRIHLAATDWKAALDQVVPIEAGWEELSSTERVWITRSLGGRDDRMIQPKSSQSG